MTRNEGIIPVSLSELGCFVSVGTIFEKVRLAVVAEVRHGDAAANMDRGSHTSYHPPFAIDFMSFQDVPGLDWLCFCLLFLELEVAVEVVIRGRGVLYRTEYGVAAAVVRLEIISDLCLDGRGEERHC
jgi:hypothetical protein